MSNYMARTKRPGSDKWEEAEWLDDYFGRHKYGVRFPDGQVFHPEEVEAKEAKPTPPPVRGMKYCRQANRNVYSCGHYGC